MAIRMQQRRGTSEQWSLYNPVLGEGEIGLETDGNKFKIGNGVDSWDELNYFLDENALGGSLEDYVPNSALGISVATLDVTGQVPANQLGNATVDLSDYALTSEVTTAVNNAVSGLVDSAPGVLDTLNELAAAIGDDASFATTVTAAIGGKADEEHTHLIADITDYVEPVSTILSDTAPSSTVAGIRWIKTTTWQEYIYFDSAWIEL